MIGCKLCHSLGLGTYFISRLNLKYEKDTKKNIDDVSLMGCSLLIGDAFRKPKLAPTISCQLHNIMLSVPPNVTKFEEELCQLLNEDHYNSSKQTTGTVTNQCINIAERRLKVSQLMLFVLNVNCYLILIPVLLLFFLLKNVFIFLILLHLVTPCGFRVKMSEMI